jgi:hypothetical protein
VASCGGDYERRRDSDAEYVDGNAVDEWAEDESLRADG